MATRSWQRANLESCTVPMLDVLKRLREAKQDEKPFLYLKDVHPHTLRALIERDWIFESVAKNGLDCTRYKITHRGLQALEIYEIPSCEYDKRRYDGICCRCNERERGWYSSGARMPYCRQCEQEIDRRKYALFGYQRNPGICPMCETREKHITASGNVRSYCKPCRKKRAQRLRKERNERNVERVRNGELLLCYRCKQAPRWLTGETLQDYCEDCARDYNRQRRMVDYEE